jgi:hypothetical protein
MGGVVVVVGVGVVVVVVVVVVWKLTDWWGFCGGGRKVAAEKRRAHGKGKLTELTEYT